MKTRDLSFIYAAAGIILAVCVWFAAGLPLIGRLIGEISAFCHGIFETCAEYKAVAGVGLFALGAFIVVAAFVYGICRNTIRFIRAQAAIEAMPKLDTGSCVVLIRDDIVLSAFTWGLISPRIYMSTGLLAALTREELTAVCLHEAAHRAGLDPLRFFLFNTLKDIFVYIPLVRQYAEYMSAKREFAADDYAAKSAGGGISLASALLKVSAGATAAVPIPASFTGYGSPSERITRLLNPKGRGAGLPLRKMRLRSVVASLSMTVFLSAVMAGPLIVLPVSASACTLKHCSLHTHTKDAGQSCKTHCKTDNAAHHIH